MGKLAASILAADLGTLAEQVELVHEHADVFHVDVMDGRFVPPVSIGPVVVASLRPRTGRALHGHLMVEGPEGLFDELSEAGTDVVAFHLEAVPDPGPVIAKARGAGMGVGLALGPDTPIWSAFPHLDDVDAVTVLGTPPAGAGEPLAPATLDRVRAVRAEIDRRGLSVDVEVDGGVTLQTAPRCVEAGATMLVVGSALFGTPDPAAAARELKAIVEAA